MIEMILIIGLSILISIGIMSILNIIKCNSEIKEIEDEIQRTEEEIERLESLMK